MSDARKPPEAPPPKAKPASEKEARKLAALERAASLHRKGLVWLTGSFTNPRVKYSHASSLFVASAEAYRMYLQWRPAADAYTRACEAERAQAAVLPAAVLAADAAECFARVDASEAVRQFTLASGLFATQERFLPAANLMMRAGELQEGDNALTAAAGAFEAAAHYFLADDEYSMAVRAYHRAGACLMLEEAFEPAHEQFERAARVALDDNLTKWHAPRLVLDAGLALLAAARARDKDREGLDEAARDAIEARLETYVVVAARRDAFFSVGKERRFLCDAIDASKVWSWDDLMDHAWNFDDVAELQPHELAALGAVSNAVREGPPPEIARVRREQADLSRVVEVEEDALVEVEEVVPQTAEEMRLSGLAAELAVEEEADDAEADADADAEYKLIHGISRLDQEKLDAERENNY